METNFEKLKEIFNLISPQSRNVQLWNKIRRIAKDDFPVNVIFELDTSGYIRTWLNGTE